MDTAQILADLRAQRNRIDNAITALEALNGTKPTSAKPGRKPALDVNAERKPNGSPHHESCREEENGWRHKKLAR